MTLEQRLDFCKICTNRKIDFNTGLICTLTQQKPAFESECPTFVKDEVEAERKLTLKLDAAGTRRSQNGSLNPRKNINYGFFLIFSGILVLSIASFLFGIIILVTGISFVIRGDAQKKIIAKNKAFNKKLNKD